MSVSNPWVVGLGKSWREIVSAARAGVVEVGFGKGWEGGDGWRSGGKRTESGDVVDVAVVVASMVLNLAAACFVGTDPVMRWHLRVGLPWMMGCGVGLSPSAPEAAEVLPS